MPSCAGPINWIAVSIAILFLLANLMIAGCGGGDDEGGIEQPEVSGMLRKVRSAAVTQNLLLGVGNEISNAKVELFDVTDIGQSRSRGSVVIEGASSYSEAEWDRHAFTYLPAESADRFAVPGTGYPVVSPAARNPILCRRQLGIGQMGPARRIRTVGICLAALGVAFLAACSSEHRAPAVGTLIFDETVTLERGELRDVARHEITVDGKATFVAIVEEDDLGLVIAHVACRRRRESQPPKLKSTRTCMARVSRSQHSTRRLAHA